MDHCNFVLDLTFPVCEKAAVWITNTGSGSSSEELTYENWFEQNYSSLS